MQIVPYSENEAAAVLAFNTRMRQANAPSGFLLPETSRTRTPTPNSRPPFHQTHYLAVEGDNVRGGFILREQPTWMNGKIHHTHNLQSPLSEGIINKKYAPVAMYMLKYIQREADLAFAVGMGNIQNPLPRLLKAFGWSIRPIPFLFRVNRVNRFLRELQLLRATPLRATLSEMATLSGVGWLSLQLLQSARLLRRFQSSGLTIEQVSSWGQWADELWDQFKVHCSFAVVRDRTTLDMLYPLANSKILCYLIRKDSHPVGWATVLNTQMENHKYFGNLRVGTILDCVAIPGYEGATATLASEMLGRLHADLLITNQSHANWVRAYRKAGFLPAKSNYLLAVSRASTEELSLAHDSHHQIHLTRGDGDGRIHL
jgi:hypothetical protein